MSRPGFTAASGGDVQANPVGSKSGGGVEDGPTSSCEAGRIVTGTMIAVATTIASRAGTRTGDFMVEVKGVI